jgi:hypothetical protein
MPIHYSKLGPMNIKLILNLLAILVAIYCGKMNAIVFENDGQVVLGL